MSIGTFHFFDLGEVEKLRPLSLLGFWMERDAAVAAEGELRRQ
jgi:hypothetical protein